MSRVAAMLLLFFAACSVPSFDVLEAEHPTTCDGNTHPCDLQVKANYRGFRPACVRITAWDADAPDKQQSTLAAPEAVDYPLTDAAKNSLLTVAMLRPAGWSHNLKFKAEAFERGACEVKPDKSVAVVEGKQPVVTGESGTVVAQDGKASDVTLDIAASDVDGDGYVASSQQGTDCNDAAATAYPGAPEICDGIDNNCDANHAVDEGQTFRDYFLDEDGDGYGTTVTRKNACAPPAVGSGHPATAQYVTQDGDCNDAEARAHPGAPEVCDGIDNNCDAAHQVDEGFNVGQSCTLMGFCDTKIACAADGTAKCSGTAAMAYYPDRDGDGHGLNSGVDYVCPGVTPKAGYVTTAGDCDDGDPFTYSGAQEICDGRDNDCNSTTTEASVCPSGGGKFASLSTGVTAINWRSVSSWGTGGVWMVGEGGNWARRAAGQSSFTLGTCGTSTTIWHSIWIDPRPNGVAFYGGDNQMLTIVSANGTGCFSNPPSVGSTGFVTRGLTGSVSSGLRLQGVGQAGSGSKHSFSWDGSPSTVSLRNSNTDVLKDVHGLDAGPVFAVGDSVGGAFSIYRLNSSTDAWVREQAPASGGIANLLGVYVVNPSLAYAVGEKGTVLRWDGTGWQVILSDANGPNTSASSTERLRSVLAFGTSSVYVTSEDGILYRYNGVVWEKLFTPGGVLYDIAGTRPDDLWVVGSSASVYHWPQ